MANKYQRLREIRLLMRQSQQYITYFAKIIAELELERETIRNSLKQKEK